METAAVVKADAYGLGAAEVAPALARAGVHTFFVALAEEGAALRGVLGPEPAIHVFSGLLAGDADLIRRFDLIPCLNSAAQVVSFGAQLAGRRCSLQLNSGMNRLGLDADELASVSDALAAFAPGLVLSHLACADLADHPQNAAQARAFRAMAGTVPAARWSLAATAGILLGGGYHHDMTRPGIGLYGGRPFAAAVPVVTLALPVIQVREVAARQTVGYGAAWTAAAPVRIATVSSGYADGILRAAAEGSVALYAGDTPCPLVGRVSMDLVTVDVSGLDRVPDCLEILNPAQGIDALADAAGTIGYEILTGLGGRLERVYKSASLADEPA